MISVLNLISQNNVLTLFISLKCVNLGYNYEAIFNYKFKSVRHVRINPLGGLHYYLGQLNFHD